jgi:prevent-host-death family protein
MELDLSKDIRSLTDFKRRTTSLVKRMKKTGHPVVLTVNGRAELVVQDADSYQKLLERIDRAEAIEGIRKGLADVQHGRTRPVRAALEDLRRKYEVHG